MNAEERAAAIEKRSRRMRAVHALGILVMVCASCTPTAVVEEASSQTSTFVETATVRPATATRQPTETEAPDPYEVTMEKLNNQPESMEYLMVHLDEFVQAPSPWEQGVDVFNKWVNEKLDPFLGRFDQRVPNVVVDFASTGSETSDLRSNGPDFVAPIGEIPFFYFLHNGIPYPVYILNGQQRGTNDIAGTMGVVIIDGWGGRQFSEIMSAVYNGDGGFRGATIITNPTNYIGHIPDEMVDLINAGFGRNDNGTRIGFGMIYFYE